MTKGSGLLDGLKGLIPGVFAESSAQLAKALETDFPRRFIPNNAHVDHGSGDTIGYAKYLKAALKHTPDQGLGEILQYVTAYVHQSRALDALDKRNEPIMREQRHWTYPRVIVELARALPDTKAGKEAKVQFMTDYLALSTTLQSHLAEHRYSKKEDLSREKPSAAWVMHSVFRTLGHDDANTLVFDLGRKLQDAVPAAVHPITQLGRMLTDYRLSQSAAPGADKRQPA